MVNTSNSRLSLVRIDELTRREDWERARAEIRARRAEEERLAAEERRRRNAEQRDNILRELLTTEREYCRDLKLLFQVRTVFRSLLCLYFHSPGIQSGLSGPIRGERH